MHCIVDVWISYHFRINILSEYIFGNYGPKEKHEQQKKCTQDGNSVNYLNVSLLNQNIPLAIVSSNQSQELISNNAMEDGLNVLYFYS